MPVYTLTKADLVSHGFEESKLGLGGNYPRSIILTSNESLDNVVADQNIVVGHCQLSEVTYLQMDVGTHFGVCINAVTFWLLATKDAGLQVTPPPEEDQQQNKLRICIPLLPVVDVNILEYYHGMSIEDRQKLVTDYVTTNNTPLMVGKNQRPPIDNLTMSDARLKAYTDYWGGEPDFSVVAVDYSKAKASVFGYEGDMDLTLVNLCTASLIEMTGNTYLSGSLRGFYIEPKIFYHTSITNLDRNAFTIDDDGKLVVLDSEGIHTGYEESGVDLSLLGIPENPTKDLLYLWENTNIPLVGLVTDLGEFKVFVLR